MENKYPDMIHHQHCVCGDCMSQRQGGTEPIKYTAYTTTNSECILDAVQFDGVGWQVYYHVKTQEGKTIWGKTTVRNWNERAAKWWARETEELDA